MDTYAKAPRQMGLNCCMGSVATKKQKESRGVSKPWGSHVTWDPHTHLQRTGRTRAWKGWVKSCYPLSWHFGHLNRKHAATASRIKHHREIPKRPDTAQDYLLEGSCTAQSPGWHPGLLSGPLPKPEPVRTWLWVTQGKRNLKTLKALGLN